MADPTNCDRCGASLERGHVQILGARGRVKSTICHACNDAERLDGWRQTGTILTGLMTRAAIASVTGKEPELQPIWVAVERVQASVDVFDREVWRGGLRAHLHGHRERGESLEFQGMKLLTFVMAGRVLITLDDPASSLTLITLEDEETRMGIQGICAREHQALDLIERARLAWKLGHRTKPDAEVHVAGMR